MKGYGDLNESAMDILRELGNIGTGNAVTSLSGMLDREVELTCPDLRIIDYREVTTILGEAEELQTGILVASNGDLRGMFLFLLDESLTRSIVELVLGEIPENIMDLGEMGESLICEIGNIMCGSYIRALARLLDIEMDVAVPELCIDMGGAILNTMMSHFLRFSEDMLLIQNVFRMEGRTFFGRILFLPELDSLRALLNKFGE